MKQKLLRGPRNDLKIHLSIGHLYYYSIFVNYLHEYVALLSILSKSDSLVHISWIKYWEFFFPKQKETETLGVAEQMHEQLSGVSLDTNLTDVAFFDQVPLPTL